MEKPHRPAILLMGPPNVGKSVLFNRLTGMNVSCANYSGTTVEVAAGTIPLNGHEAMLFDAPGIYTLDASNEAEQIAIDMLERSPAPPCIKGSHCGNAAGPSPKQDIDQTVVLCVLDACNLESSLFLLLQIMQYGLPMMAVLNRTDLALDKGRRIDHAHLSSELGIPVLPTVAVTGEGLDRIAPALAGILDTVPAQSDGGTPMPRQAGHDALWSRAENLARTATTREDGGEIKANNRRKWGLMLVQPWPGIPLATLILTLVFAAVVGLGMGLRQWVLLPLFRGVIIPAITSGVETITSPGMLQDILIGDYGFLVKGLEWPFALVLPYIISFYLVLSILEDSGYMPRLGALIDGILNRVGLRGSGIVPLILGYGCAIPAIMATRALETAKERMVLCTMVCLAVPCVAQSGAIISLLAEQSVAVVALLFLLSIVVLAVTGFLMDLIIKAPRRQTVMEIPELLLPSPRVVGKKVWMRVRNFVTNGALPMIGAIGLAAILFESGALTALASVMSPVVTGWLALPQEAAGPLVLGILRRELTVLPLLEMDLTSLQLFVGAAVGLFYIPCIAVVAQVTRQFGLKAALGILLLTMTVAIFGGGLLARAGALLT